MNSLLNFKISKIKHLGGIINEFFFNKFYHFLFYLLNKIILVKFIHATLHLGFSKTLSSKKFSSFFLGQKNSKIIYNLLFSIFILKQFIIFVFKIFSQGGHFLIYSKHLLPEKLFEYLYNFNQDLIFGMPFGGLLSNRRFVIKKLKAVSYSFYGFELNLIDDECKKKILHCERMLYNLAFRENYFKNYSLPHCLIIFDLNSYLFFETAILNIPVLGMFSNLNNLGFVTYPLLVNYDGIYSLFLLLIFLYNILKFSFFLDFIDYKLNLLSSFTFLKKNNKNFLSLKKKVNLTEQFLFSKKISINPKFLIKYNKFKKFKFNKFNYFGNQKLSNKNKFLNTFFTHSYYLLKIKERLFLNFYIYSFFKNFNYSFIIKKKFQENKFKKKTGFYYLVNFSKPKKRKRKWVRKVNNKFKRFKSFTR